MCSLGFLSENLKGITDGNMGDSDAITFRRLYSVCMRTFYSRIVSSTFVSLLLYLKLAWISSFCEETLIFQKYHSDHFRLKV